MSRWQHQEEGTQEPAEIPGSERTGKEGLASKDNSAPRSHRCMWGCDAQARGVAPASQGALAMLRNLVLLLSI